LLEIARAFVIFAGISAALLGLLLGGLCILAPFISEARSDLVGATTIGGAFISLGLGLGLPLAWQGLSSLLGRPSSPFRPKSLWPLVVAFALVLVIGQAVFSLDLLAPLAFPPLYILSIAIPPLFILAFVGKHLTDLSFREVILQLSGGAFLAPILSFGFELVLGLLLLFTASFFVALIPGGMKYLQNLSTNLQNPAWLEDPANLYKLLLSPPVLVIIIFFLVVVAPVVEEFLKPLGVAIMSYRRPSKARAFLWGLAGGAGFALSEGLFNATLNLKAWGVVALVRAGAAAMHCIGGGLVGLGLYHLISSRRPWRLLGAYGASVTLHALWNASTISILLASLFVLTSPESEVAVALAGLLILMLVAFVLLLTLVMASLILFLTKTLEEKSALGGIGGL